MLAMSRWPGQQIVIDGQVWITVRNVSENGRVQLTFEAPRHIVIDRAEIHERKEQEKANANKR